MILPLLAACHPFDATWPDDTAALVDTAPCEIRTWYLDHDGDGWGSDRVTATGCAPPAGFVSDATDCDDTLTTVHPGAAEVSFDGIDQDCDGLDGATLEGDLRWDAADATVQGTLTGGAGALLVDLGDGRAGTGENGAVRVFQLPESGIVALSDVTVATLVPDAEEWYVHGLDAGDFDGDGIRDLAAAVDDTVAVWKGPCVADATGSDATGLITSWSDDVGSDLGPSGDFDGDGREDLWVPTLNNYYNPAELRLYLGPIEGAQTTEDASILVLGGLPGPIIDVDGDGLSEAIVLGGGYIWVLEDPTRGAVDLDTLDPWVQSEWGLDSAASGDVDGDGLPDLLAIFEPGDEVNDAGWQIPHAEVFAGPLSSSTPVAVFHGDPQASQEYGDPPPALADLDADGFADPIVPVPHDYTAGFDAGAVFAWYGPVEGDRDFLDADLRLWGEQMWDQAGDAVVGVPGDFADDLLVGIPSDGDEDGPGRIAIFHGRPR